MGCWDLKIDRDFFQLNPWFTLSKNEWFLGDTELQQKILELAVRDTVDISEIMNHLEYVQNPLELAEETSTTKYIKSLQASSQT